PVEVATPPYTAEGKLSRDEVAFKVAVERLSDGVGDAFEVKLPIRDDRQRVTTRLLAELRAGAPVALPAVPEAARPGTVRRTVLVSDQPALLRMAAGLDFFQGYPYGCTEQFLVDARAGGFAVDQKLFDTLTNSLDQALRSDYSHFIDGEAFAERAWALSALADAGKFNPGYAAELARRAQFLDLEGVSEVALALARQGDTQSSTVEGLVGRLWDGIV